MRLLLLLVLLLCASSGARAEAGLLQNGDFARGLEGWRSFDSDVPGGAVSLLDKAAGRGTRGTVALVDAQAGPWKKALRATVRARAGDAPSAFGVRALGAVRPELDLQFGHGGGVNSVAYSPDGKTVASGGKDGTVKLWDVASSRLLRTIRERDNGEAVLSVAFSPDGRSIATGCQDPEVRLRDARSGALQSRFFARNGWQWAVAFSPDGKSIARTNLQDDLKTELIQLVDVRTGDVRKTFSGSGGVIGLSFSPDGSLLASGGWDGQVRLWDLASGQFKRAASHPLDTVYGVSFSPDGQTVAGAVHDDKGSSVLLWDARTGALRKGLLCPGVLNSVAFAPDGKSIAGAGNGVFLWDFGTGALLRAWAGEKSGIRKLSFSPDGQTLAGGSDDTTISLWDVRVGAERSVLGFNLSAVSVAVSPDGRTLASSHGDHLVRLWDLRTGELKKAIAARGVSSLLFSGEGTSLVTGDSDGAVQMWDVASGQSLRRMEGHVQKVQAVALSPDHQVLASGDNGGAIRLWDARSGAPRSTFETRNAVFALAFSPDGKRLACGLGTQASILDARSGAVLHELKGYRYVVSSVAFSPDGRSLAASGWAGEVKMWDASTGALMWGAVGYDGRNRPMVFSQDGASVLCGGNGKIIFFDARTGEERRRIVSQGGGIFALCFTPDYKTLIAGGEDSIKLWDAQDARLLASIVALPPQASAPSQSDGGKPITAESRGITADARGITADARGITADARGITADARDVGSSGDYLVVTAEGYYSGSATVDRYVQFKLLDDSFPAECFQARYYWPEMVRLALAGQAVPPVGEFKGVYPPLAAFTSQHASTLTGDTATISVQTSDDSEVKSVAFFVNGARVDARATMTQARPITADSRAITVDAKPIVADAKPIVAESRPLTAGSRALPRAHKITRTFTATLPLPLDASNVKLQAIAFDDDGLQSPRAEISLPHIPAAAAVGKLLGLCVGVSRYQDARLNLKFADADANALAADLSAQQQQLYSAAQVLALVNQAATSAAVSAALDALIAQATRADTVIISFSGHGWRDGSGRFYFATTEVNRNDVARTALPWSEVIARLTRLSEKSKRVIVLLDACHSGSAATNEEMVKAILGANAGVMILASSRGSEVSLESADWAHGAFSKALLEAAAGLAVPGDDKRVTTIDLIAYVSRRVKALTENRQHPQVPFLQDFDTDAPILAKP